MHRHTQSPGEVLNYGILRGLFAFGAGDRDFLVLVIWRLRRKIRVKADCDVWHFGMRRASQPTTNAAPGSGKEL